MHHLLHLFIRSQCVHVRATCCTSSYCHNSVHVRTIQHCLLKVAVITLSYNTKDLCLEVKSCSILFGVIVIAFVCLIHKLFLFSALHLSSSVINSHRINHCLFYLFSYSLLFSKLAQYLFLCFNKHNFPPYCLCLKRLHCLVSAFGLPILEDPFSPS